MAKKVLSNDFIEQYLNVPSGSEDGLDFSSAESDDDMKKIRENLDQMTPDSDSENDVEPTRCAPVSSTYYSTPFAENNFPTSPLFWTYSFIAANHHYRYSIAIFFIFFDEDLLTHIVEEMHKFSIQKDPSKPFCITTYELKKFLGICLLMSIAPLPNIRMYWETELGIPLVRETMSVNHFEKMRQFLHFHENSLQVPSCHPGHDRLHKIRPILESLKKKCQSIPKRETLLVDEKMCATKAANFLRQYLPNKPQKLRYKLLVLCDDRGMAYDFEIYSGMENNSALRYANEPDLGASSNIVSIQSLGTVNKVRLGKDLKIPFLKDLKSTNDDDDDVVDGTEVGTVML
ncbi:piggyBac transposable element-derived protein 4-like [Vanessa cardui]|uniref:piggyBac transposable element-derived protein 4-like n=1 Tax=Vanessa cardui TaxID=171605 RepID=UPI001F1448FA|nr:piggyBac transposable element-derived protein 4-like [Vanessa cardui]